MAPVLHKCQYKRSLKTNILRKSQHDVQLYCVWSAINAIHFYLDPFLYCKHSSSIGYDCVLHCNQCKTFKVGLCTVLGRSQIKGGITALLNCNFHSTFVVRTRSVQCKTLILQQINCFGDAMYTAQYEVRVRRYCTT